MIQRASLAIAWCALAFAPAAFSQGGVTLPSSVAAGSAFSIQTSGSGKATLYIVGLGQVIKRDVQLGGDVFIAAGSLHNAGRYVVMVTGNGMGESHALTVTPAAQPAHLTFLARPSRLPVGLRDGITGAVYVFDAYENLITAPEPVNFDLSSPGEHPQTRTVITHNGAAWTEMDSTAHQGNDNFIARIGSVSSTRVVGQVPGDPCGLKMTASSVGREVKLQTAPVRDCSGNPVPDGTVVTFTEAYGDSQSTVDVPIKRGVAEVEMPAHPGATITVASGVVMGNQIRWGKQ